MDKQVSYWIDESLETIDAAKVLLDKNKYLEAAYFCHLSCEKMLKAAVVQHTSQVPPKIHALNRLAKHASVDQTMNKSQQHFLDHLDVFQLEARYPQDRHKLYQTTPPSEFVRIHI
ncbi:HEPN domain-containing protein [Salicibibacter cibarius]|uniref:HEPN domain-containing protein n=1 Tax=Salicibibacter cibarius TaxID=2743000 RepID=A0A7T7CC32_9BACI|nr:HEPN domain-containing protein [Salicibibacter cibarius]QQK76475.1 HEPN domain-containing protein [Salicibibacter cibarius]